MMKTAYDIVIRPIITEQSMEDLDIKKYAFEVAKDANKGRNQEGNRGDLRRYRYKGHHTECSRQGKTHRRIPEGQNRLLEKGSRKAQ